MSPHLGIVTGAASGIGLATAELLLKKGWRVGLLDRDSGPLQATARQLDDHMVTLHPIDVCDEAEVTSTIASLSKRFGPVRGAVTCAGVAADVPFLDTTAKQVRRVFDVNLVGTFTVTKACAASMANAQAGSIVTISSVSGLRGSPGRSAYAASKGAVIALTKVMAVELAAAGIRVNCIAPGSTETPLVAAVHTPQQRAAIQQAIPLHRYAQPCEIADTIAFLLSDKSSFVTGQILGVDGGQLAGAGW